MHFLQSLLYFLKKLTGGGVPRCKQAGHEKHCRMETVLCGSDLFLS